MERKENYRYIDTHEYKIWNWLTYLTLSKWLKCQSAAMHVPYSGSVRYGYTTQINNNNLTKQYLYNKKKN